MIQTLAHPGHGATEGGSLWHYLVEPSHLPFTIAAATAIVGVVAWSIVRARRSSRNR